ncbi:MAG: T9SS type A sorting domain-containing protein [Bacteroidales bacterium]|jgi:hypothetical protein|nr:T9SS type A sorting domain-containing protein [Bacteroidales bacterium]
MKKIKSCRLLLLFIIIGWVSTIAGQTNDNTIVIPNSSWSILSYGLGAYLVPCNVLTRYVYFDGDSIVADKTYRKVFSCNDWLHENIMSEGLIREQDKKTYFIPKDSEIEYLLYDFSLEEGANFEYQDPWRQIPENKSSSEIFYVKKVDFVKINGIQKKRIQLTDLPPYDNIVYTVWVENIGSLAGFYRPCGIPAPGGYQRVICYFQNSELIYKNSMYSECYYDKAEGLPLVENFSEWDDFSDVASVESITTDNLTIYPNPVDNILIISSLNDAISFVEITDVSGKTVYAKRLSANKKYDIDMSHFISGMYFFRVYDTKGLVSTFKIIKR